MRTRHQTEHRRRRTRRGFSLVEAVISTLLVGVVLIAALRSSGAALANRNRNSAQITAQCLANGLMWEILAQDYMEPGSKSSAIAKEASESATSRANYDDVDDYGGWTASPPENKDDTVLPGYTGWQQSAAVVWVNPDDIQQVSFVETGAKRITVTVSKNGAVLATRIAVKTNSP